MMGDPRFRLYLDDRPAARDQLDQIDEVQVDQVVDAAWQAHVQIPICTDDKGNWCYPGEGFAATFGRLRVELDAGDGTFQPLIDGPIVGRRQTMSFQPGQSVETIVVHDDSVLLNRVERTKRIERRADSQIARDIFGGDSHIASSDIDSSTRSGADGEVIRFQRETDIQFLRRLARDQGMHAYVLPGNQPGKSVGAFKPFPTKPDGLPPLILLGPDRNVETFHPHEDAQAPATVTAQTLSLVDKSVTRASKSFRDVRLLGSAAAGAAVKVAATRILPPGADGAIDADTAARAAAERFSYAFKADGRVATGCYTAALSPYRVVTVKGVSAELSGDYLIRRVSHHITRSVYTQRFVLARNARSSGGGSGPSPPLPF
jgi:phage protein D